MISRDPLLDKAKGIGIILLILGHLFTYKGLPFSLIFSFHMPLFFFISGMFLSPAKGGVKKYIFKYSLPYFFFQFIIGSLIILPVSYLRHEGFGETYMIMLDEIWKRIGSPISMMESLWFLIVLSVSLIICRYVLMFEDINTGPKNRLFVFLVLSTLTILCSLLPYGYMPLRIAAIPGATFIIYLGNKYGKEVVSLSKKFNSLEIFFFSLLLFIIVLINKTINISTPTYNDFFLFLLGSYLGITITFWLSSKLDSHFLEFIGRNSLILFAVHGIWLRVYSLVVSYIVGERLYFAENIPGWLCLIGSIFVLFMSIVTFYCIKDIYNIYYKSFKKVLNF